MTFLDKIELAESAIMSIIFSCCKNSKTQYRYHTEQNLCRTPTPMKKNAEIFAKSYRPKTFGHGNKSKLSLFCMKLLQLLQRIRNQHQIQLFYTHLNVRTQKYWALLAFFVSSETEHARNVSKKRKNLFL